MVDKDKLAIWQQNINKSPTGQHDLVSNNALALMGIDVIAIQEPSLNALKQTIASKNWFPIYPSPHNESPDKTRSIILIRSDINTESWNQLDFPSSDVTAIQVKGEWGLLTLINVYNDGNNNETINKLSRFQQTIRGAAQEEEEARTHTIWLGDFNRHHPHWDDPSDTRLFTSEATRAAEVLIETLAENDLVMALPSGLQTHCHNVTKRWTRLDQVFISEHSENLVISCDTLTEHRGANTDHLPIRTELNLKLKASHFQRGNAGQLPRGGLGSLQRRPRETPRQSNSSGGDRNAKTTRSVLRGTDHSHPGDNPYASPSNQNIAKIEKMVDKRAHTTQKTRR